MIWIASSYIPNYITFLVVEYCSNITEPNIDLLEKFHGRSSKFWRFANKVSLMIEIKPQNYPASFL